MTEIRINHWTKFGAAIRDARRAQSLSQAELAERAGVSRSWLAKLEAGHRGAEFEQILRVLSALGLTMTLRDDRPNTDETTAKAHSDATSAAERLRRNLAHLPSPTEGEGWEALRSSLDPESSPSALLRLLAARSAGQKDRLSAWERASSKAGERTDD